MQSLLQGVDMVLDDKIIQEIKTTQEELTSQGQLPTKAQLEEYYGRFRERFGPERLASLDGEALLNTMHDYRDYDSLVYWLEWKNDDEFPAIFGSISGGSALKFGIYKRRETGIWMTGHPQKQQELSIQEAVEIARKQRDQFIEGARLVADLPPGATDEQYASLQQALERVAPDVENSAWGHKYFSLLYPDKLDDHHVLSYQRFHLIRILQVPPPGDGRYLAAGRYVAIAQQLDMPVKHLSEILGRMHGLPYKYWRIGTQISGVGRPWELMQESECVAIGWPELGDLSDITYNRESKAKIRTQFESRYPQPPQGVGPATQQIFNFVTRIEEGDLVLPSNGRRVLGIGRITGEYVFQTDSDAPHRRPVDWLSWEEWELPTTEGLQTTVHQVGQHTENLVEIERRVLYAPPLPAPPPPVDLDQVQSYLAPRLPGVTGRIQAVLERKMQVILYGPPGTGKTYWAMQAAHELAAHARFGKGFEQLSDGQKAIVFGSEQQPDGLSRMCTFHPAYGYEDFLEGYKPVSVNDQLLFEKRDGIFKKLCEDARGSPQRYYLIIDEINRGDIPRIFGELLTILEKDKRGKSILLPLAGEPFHVPDNVYVIGTMNTADRSIALLDTALRRRFGFIELMPDSSILGDTVVGGVPLGPWLDALNQRICEHVGRDARNLQIGHAYLLDHGRPVSKFPRFARIVQDDILPLLEEYCYEDYAALEKILGKGLVDTNRQRIHHELFDASRQDDLIQALLAPCPEIVASAVVVAAEADGVEDLEDGNEANDGENDEGV